MRDVAPRQLEHDLGDIDAGHRQARVKQLPRSGQTRAAADVEDPRAGIQLSDQPLAGGYLPILMGKCLIIFFADAVERCRLRTTVGCGWGIHAHIPPCHPRARMVSSPLPMITERKVRI
jgi:hypothetical protein